jgi:hypothetical protein
MAVATLSFSLGPATTWKDLTDAALVRALGYGRHAPSMRSTLEEPDEVDLLASTAVFICRDKGSGQPVGTARIQVSTQGPVLIGSCVTMPDEIARDSFGEITRLASVPGSDPLVKLALMKAGYLYCVASQVRWLVIGARNEALIRQYMRLGFQDLHPSPEPVRLGYAGGIPHRILKFDLVAAERTWHASRHPLYQFMVETVHPDIQLFQRTRIRRVRAELVA